MKFFRLNTQTFQILVAKYLLQFNVNPILYFLSLSLSVLHCWIAVLLLNNQLLPFLNLIDISTYLPLNNLLIIFSIGCFLVVILIILQLYLAIKNQSLEMQIIQKYLIKIIGNIGFMLTTIGMLPLVRTCYTIIITSNSNSYYMLSMVTLFLYIFIILPFHNFVVVDFSPLSGNIYSSINYLSAMRISHILKLILIVDFMFQKPTNIIVILICLSILILLSIKEPLQSYNFGTITLIISYSMPWIMLVRSIGTFEGKPIIAGMIIVGCPIFIGGMMWLTSTFFKKVLLSEDGNPNKIKYLTFIIKSIQNNSHYLGAYILNHLQKCKIVDCTCQTMRDNIIHDQNYSKKWYQLLANIIDHNFNSTKFKEIPSATKNVQLQKIAQIIQIKADILAKILNKWSSAYYDVEQLIYELDKQDALQFHFRIYKRRFTKFFQQHLILQSFKEGSINQFASDYYEFQMKQIQLNKKIRNSTIKHLQIFQELNNKDCDGQNIKKLIRQAYKCHSQVQSFINKITIKQQQQAIKLLYNNYKFFVCNQKIGYQNIKDEILTNIKDLNLKYFSKEAQTSMCISSLDQYNFGNIIKANQYFYKMTGYNISQTINIKDLILPQFQDIHNDLMKKFIKSDKLKANPKNAIVVTLSQKLIITEIIIQLIPSLMHGFLAVTFFTQENKSPLFLTQEKAQIIKYNKQFQEIMMFQQINAQDLDQKFNQSCLRQVIYSKFILLQIGFIRYKISLFKTIQCKQPINHSNYYLCQLQVSQYNQIQQKYIKLQLQKKSPKTIKQYLIPKIELVQKDNKQSQLNNLFQKDNIKDKRKTQQQGYQLQKILEQNISIVLKTNSIFLIKIWRIITLVLLLVVLFFSIYFQYTSLLRKQQLWKTVWERHQFQTLTDGTLDALYFLRCSQIQSLTTKQEQKFNYYILQTINGNNKAIRTYNNITFNQAPLQQGFNVFKNGTISLQQTNLYVIFNMYLLISISRLSNVTINQLSFSLDRSQWSVPYSKVQVNFLLALLNGLYSAIPTYQQMKNQIIKKNECILGKCFQSEKILLFAPLCILIALIVTIYSIILQQKIKNIKDHTYDIINIIDEKQINQRFTLIQQFFKVNYYEKDNFVLVIEQKVAIGQKKSQLSNIEDIKYGKNQRNFKNVLRTIPSTAIQIDIPQIKQTQYNNLEQKQLENVFINSQYNIKIHHNKLVSILKIISIFLPMLILLLILISYVKNTNQFFRQTISIHQALHDRIKYLKRIKIYTLQYGLDDGPYNDKQKYTIQQLFYDTIDKQYEIQRQVISKIIQNQANSQLKKLVSTYNNQNVCDYIFKNSSRKPNIQIKWNKQQCQNIGGKNYLKHGLRSAIINYIESSRQIFLKYQKCPECNSQYKLNFSQLSIHKDHRILEAYFQYSISLQTSTLKADFSKNLDIYTSRIKIFTIGLVLLILISIILNEKVIKKLMIKDKQDIQSVFSFLSENIIRKNQKVKMEIGKNINYNILK